jgi:hypothetical protein
VSHLSGKACCSRVKHTVYVNESTMGRGSQTEWHSVTYNRTPTWYRRVSLGSSRDSPAYQSSNDPAVLVIVNIGPCLYDSNSPKSIIARKSDISLFIIESITDAVEMMIPTEQVSPRKDFH